MPFRLVVVMAILSSSGAAEKFANAWPTATPEEAGFDSAALVGMFEFVERQRTPVHSVQIVRDGRLALDAYFYPYNDQMLHDVASVTKSITSTMVGLSIDQGLLKGVEERITPLLGWQAEGRVNDITVENLLTMEAGWDCGFVRGEPELFQMRESPDWAGFMLKLPTVAQPGERWAYCSGNCHLLSMILSRVTGTNALGFARKELFGPLGIASAVWPADARGNNHGWGDLQLHPRDMARIGQLFLQRGEWKGRRIISEQWVEQATRAHVTKTSNEDGYGYYWWVKRAQFPGIFEAVGRGGQRINVWPVKNLVIVITGGGFEPGDLTPFLLKALKSDKALPENRAALKKLRKSMDAAKKGPTRQRVSILPGMAAAVSGKKFTLSTNSLNLTEIAFEFPNRRVAAIALTWEGRKMRAMVGLDGVERFSVNTIVDLPQAAKGRWKDERTFALELDLVGGINFYAVEFTFMDGGRELRAMLRERTGLKSDHFSGRN